MNAELADETKRAGSANVTKPFWWSVRRELWENKALYIAPLIVAVVELFGFAVSTIGMPERRRAVLMLDEARQKAMISQPYDVAAMMLIFTAFIVGVFYCLDALYGERRDRSILFWKSLPVSDVTTVLAKFTVAMVVLPLITFVAVVATQFIMMIWSSIVLLPGGMAGTTWTRFNLFQQSFILIYGLIAIALWHAPIYGWTLLVSGFVRRAALLWAVLPLIAISVVEKIAFNTSHFASMLFKRLTGFAPAAFDFSVQGAPTADSLTQSTPIKFLATPDLWIGLAFAAVFVITAIRLRRYGGPI